MTTLQIVLLSLAGVCVLASIVFMIMFIVEISVESKEEETVETPSVFINNNVVVNEEKESASVSDMLANLDKQSKEDVESTEEAKEETAEVVEEEKNETVENTETVEETPVEEAPVEEAKEEVKEESTEEVKTEEVKEETVEEKAAETPIEEVAETIEGGDEDSSDDDNLDDILEFKSEPHEDITAGSVIDYKARLEKIIANRDKIDRDLGKIQKSILKYERTKRRMNRNQKMLDRRAGELTNLNLVMYSVTDIKNVDEEKKAKQEELTAHIAELKASIQDADEFIESNKEKNDHNVKMAKFLLQEKSRYNEEIAELQELIRRSEDTTETA